MATDGVKRFQLYLLDQMRAEREIDRALVTLGATRDEMHAAHRELKALGFGGAAHPTSLYLDLLGAPREVAPSERDVALLRYRLPLWPELDFTVEQVGGDRAANWYFRRVSGANVPRALEPWQILQDEVMHRLPPATPGDQWNHMVDWLISLGGGSQLLLCFDFALLQRVEFLDDEPGAK
jgi:hypothetical protein